MKKTIYFLFTVIFLVSLFSVNVFANDAGAQAETTEETIYIVDLLDVSMEDIGGNIGDERTFLIKFNDGQIITQENYENDDVTREVTDITNVKFKVEEEDLCPDITKVWQDLQVGTNNITVEVEETQGPTAGAKCIFTFSILVEEVIIDGSGDDGSGDDGSQDGSQDGSCDGSQDNTSNTNPDDTTTTTTQDDNSTVDNSVDNVDNSSSIQDDSSINQDDDSNLILYSGGATQLPKTGETNNKYYLVGSIFIILGIASKKLIG